MLNSVRADAWWAPQDIYFSLEQVKWLVSILPILREGRWLPKPHGGLTRLTASSRQKKPAYSPFESPAMIAAEMDARLKSCGADAWLVKAVFSWDEDEISLGLEKEILLRRIGRCLKYISGWKRKTSRYSDWTRQTEYRRRQPVRL
jgi:hypothetical protein